MNILVKSKLSIGIILRDKNIPFWVLKIIEKLACSDYAEIKFWILEGQLPSTYKNKRQSFIYSLHQRLDHLVFKKRIDYTKKLSLKKMLADYPAIPIYIAGKESIEQIADSIRNTISPKPDVILNFGDRKDYQPCSGISTYGVWTYNLGNGSARTKYIAAYWETIASMPEIRISVRIAHADGNRESEIYSSGLRTYRYSPLINLNRIYALASKIIPRLIAKLQQNGENYFNSLIRNGKQPEELREAEFQEAPNSLPAFKNAFKLINKLVSHKMRYGNHRRWFLEFRIGSQQVKFPFRLENFTRLQSPRNVDWADPFVLARDNKFYIFFEEFIHKINKGHISMIEVDNKGNVSPARTILEKPFHLSYPFVFELEGQYYMIPESNFQKTVDLYSCIKFPDQWEYKMTLLNNINAKDSTLLYYENKWWLFTAVNETPDIRGHDELYIFYSDDLFSENWQAHSGNPVITDIKYARPAGKIFIQNGVIYRPSQDCSGNYGRAVNINRIVTLTETEYSEVHDSRIEANWEPDLRGPHTVNFDNNFLVLDAWKYRKRSFFR